MAKVDISMPALGQTVAEGSVVKWLKEAGDAVAADESLVVIATDKAETEVPSPLAGVLAEILVAEGKTVAVGSVIARLDTNAAAELPAGPARPEARPPATTERSAFLSPAVRRLAREHGLTAADVLAVSGTGRGGRVTHEDLRTWLADPDEAGGGDATSDTEVIPLVGIRARVAEHVSDSRREIPEVTTVTEADMSRLAGIRARHAEAFRQRHGFKLSWNAFLLAASARALAEAPMVNARLEGRSIVTNRRVHLGMAVALEPTGLAVPVLRDAHAKSVRELALEAKRLADLARSGGLGPDDMAGGTCTVTNPGVFGTLFGTPVIHHPQAAIVDFGAIKKRVVVTPDDAIAVRLMAYVVLAWDHRVLDGAEASRFLQRLVEILETFPEGID